MDKASVVKIHLSITSQVITAGIIENCCLERMNEGVVSKETVVLRRWGSSIQKFGFINGVDNVNWPPYRDSTENRDFRISVRWPIYIINSVDKTKFLLLRALLVLLTTNK